MLIQWIEGRSSGARDIFLSKDNYPDSLSTQGIIQTKIEVGIRFWAPNLG